MSHSNSLGALVFRLLPVYFAVACAGDLDEVDSKNDRNQRDLGTTKTDASTSTSNGGTDSSTTDSTDTGEGTCSDSGNCAGYTTDELACNDAPYRSCISSCGTGSPEWRNANCVDGAWQCPSGFVALDRCAPDSCAASHTTCCNLTTGVIDVPACGTDGNQRTCEGGTITTPSDGCVPPSLGVTDCMSLQGLSCDGTVLRCDQLVPFCDCKENDTGALAWSCLERLF